MTKSKAAPGAAAPAKKSAVTKTAVKTTPVVAAKIPAKKSAAVKKAAAPAKKAASKAVAKKSATKTSPAKKAPTAKKVAAKKSAPAAEAGSRKAASIVKPAAAPKTAIRQPWSNASIETLRALKAIYTALDDKKASDIRILHLGARSSLVDFYVIATSLAETHLRALHIETEKAFDLLKYPIIGIDRQTDSGWVVVDTSDIMVHIFTEEKRGHYALEANWKDAEIVNPALLPA